MRHLLNLFELSREEIERIFAISAELKARLQRGIREPLLPGRVLGLLFEKPSLRTRVSFEAAIAHLGGHSLFLGKDVGWGERESIVDFAQVLSQYVDVVVCRANVHHKVEELAKYSQCSIINGLTDQAHPCQALADLFTLLELRGSFRGAKLAYVGDANNVACSLAVACAALGVEFAIAAPQGYQLASDFVAAILQAHPTASLIQTENPQTAVQGAHAIYTDVWTSMGQEAERQQRAKAFADYQVNSALMKLADPQVCFLHCLPARRGEEVAEDVIDGKSSAVLPQAANRMHVQKGLLAWLLDVQL